MTVYKREFFEDLLQKKYNNKSLKLNVRKDKMIFDEIKDEYTLVVFRPSFSVYFKRNLPFSKILVPCQRFEKSPWCCCILKKSCLNFTGTPELEVLGKRDSPFDYEKLKIKASKDYEIMKNMEECKNYEHRKRRNENAAFQAGRSDLTTQVIKTPEKLLNRLNKTFKFDHDPCPIKPDYDCMKSKWKGKMNYVNPPFKHSGAFALRAFEQSMKYSSKTVLIVPVSGMLTRWFQELVNSGGLHAIVFLRDGISFDGYKRKVPFCLNLLLIGPKKTGNAKIYFWDIIGEDMKRQIPTTHDDYPLPLKDIGW
ncbi:MAG: hypothetical protein GY823_05885 [Flavobacteriaceae bacterium]|nr:hypothetical protein [Flavobacteriaceae bacterium]